MALILSLFPGIIKGSGLSHLDHFRSFQTSSTGSSPAAANPAAFNSFFRQALKMFSPTNPLICSSDAPRFITASNSRGYALTSSMPFASVTVPSKSAPATALGKILEVNYRLTNTNILPASCLRDMIDVIDCCLYICTIRVNGIEKTLDEHDHNNTPILFETL